MPNQQPDTTSFLSRHRTICAVLEELKDYTIQRLGDEERRYVIELVAEAKDYAQRMSNRLMEYKRVDRYDIDPGEGQLFIDKKSDGEWVLWKDINPQPTNK